MIAEVNGSFTNALHYSKEQYFSTTLLNFIKTDPTKLWNYLIEKKNTVTETLLQTNTNRIIINEKRGIAEHFNVYFNTLFLLQLTASPLPQSTKFSNFVSHLGVLSMLLNLIIKASSGSNNIAEPFLCQCVEPLAKYMVIISHVSLSRSSLPKD